MTPTSHNRWLQRLLCVVVLLIGLPSGCSQDTHPADFSGKTPLLRILLLSNQTSVTLTANETPSAKLGAAVNARPVDVSSGSSFAVTLSPAGWQLGSAQLGGGELTLIPGSEGSLYVNTHAYRGHYRFVARSATTFDLVNDVDVESYLKGVVAKEMLPDWAPEAYKAQAVVARTYALYQSRMRATSANRFDLYCDERDQVYGGISGETSKSRRAVEETRGQVVVYGKPSEEKIFKAYFSSCCGGVGQSAADAFGDPAIPPLAAQANGTLCSASPRYSWPTVVVSKLELTRRFKKYGLRFDRPEKDMATLSRIDVLGVNVLGRAVRFVVTDVKGRRFPFTGEELRVAVNTDSTPATKLLSSLFQLQLTATDVRFVNGHGFGHGVGMCQYCTEKRAENGETFANIVTESFPKSKVVLAY